MAQTPPPSITPTPLPAPQRGDRVTFSNRVDAFITWLTTAVQQFADTATATYNNAVDAYASAGSAASNANAAQATVGVAAWVSGTTYAKNVAVISQVNYQTYRRIVAGAGTTDPANDQTNWRLLTGNDSNGAFVPVTMPALDMDLSKGNYFKTTQGSSSAFTFSNLPGGNGGYSWTMELTTTAAILTSFPSSVRSFNSTPLQANKRHLFMFVTSDGGTTVSMVTAANGPV